MLQRCASTSLSTEHESETGMLELPDRNALEDGARIVRQVLAPTPQYAWPGLAAALGTSVWLKHENHTPLATFKIRGGATYLERLRRRLPGVTGIISASRGNHGQSLAFHARRLGMRCVIYVPHGNSVEKNVATRALGAELREHGADYQAAREEADRVAAAERLHFVPALHSDIVLGVATYWAEFFNAVPELDLVYVPIGQGSGIIACIAARDALAPRTRIVGVVSDQAPCFALSFAAGRVVEAPVTTQLADGLACRTPDGDAVAVIGNAVERIVQVSDAEIAAAMRLLFATTHNVAEGAGAAALAAALQDRAQIGAHTIGLPLTGGNVDSDRFARVLAGGDF